MTTFAEQRKAPPGGDSRRALVRGLTASLPFLLVIVPFGLLFGVVGTEAGLALPQVMGFSILVIAGASQFAAVQMLADDAPTLIILATALAVNLRMAMYSAAMAPHLGAAPLWQRACVAYLLTDQSYAACALEFERRPAQSRLEKTAFFMGAALPVGFGWYAMTFVGATVGARIPASFALDFAIPITFLAIVGPMLRTVPHVAAAVVSVAGTLLLGFLPFNAGLLIAALLAMLTGALTESWLDQRRGAG